MKKRLALVAFLFVLYIAPVILGPSSMPSAIAAQKSAVADGENWLTGWEYRRQLNITGQAGAGVNYQVTFELEYVGLGTLDEFRFTDSDGHTVLDHWVETSSILTGNATFWVEVADSLETDCSIYMYYGNAVASTLSNGTATFPLFEDWASETVGDQWTIGTANGAYSFSATGATHGSIIKVEGGAGTAKEEIYSDDAYNSTYSLRMRSKLESTAAAYQIVQMGLADYGANAYALLKNYQGADQFVAKDDDGNLDTQTADAANFDVYATFDIFRDGTNAYLYRDGAIQETASCSPDVLGMNINIYCRDTEYDLYSDWLFVHKWVSGVEVNAIGEEEEGPAAEWHTVATGLLWFNLLANTLSGWFVLTGLAMIPLSTVYLAYAKKHDSLTMTTVFFFVIVFVFGWALVIGGIGP